MTGLIVAAGVLAAAIVIVTVGPHFWTRRDGGGDDARGIVLFVESIRWLNVPWGKRTVAKGLRQAGFKGRFVYRRWHATWRGMLVLPAIMASGMLERRARELADVIVERRRTHGDAPIIVFGYSCGAYVALRALELLPPGVRVDAAAMLAGAFAPRRPLTTACEHIAGKLVVTSSVGDGLICGLGTLLFGTADRDFTPSVAMLGPRGAGADGPKVVHLPWRPAMMASGNFGEHFSASAAGFVRDFIAPHLDLRR